MLRKKAQKSDSDLLNQGITPYSESLAAPLRPLVAKIDGGGFAGFVTRAFTLDDGASHIWYRAWKNDETGRWAVTRCRTIGDIDNPDAGLFTGQDHLHLDLCFFDALYACAQFETSNDLLKFPARDQSADKTHYSRIIEALHIPLDPGQMPLPVYNGEIIAPGAFDQTAVAAAKKSTALIPALPLRQTLDSIALAEIAAEKENVLCSLQDILAQKEQEKLERTKEIEAQFNQDMKKLEAQLNQDREDLEKEFNQNTAQTNELIRASESFGQVQELSATTKNAIALDQKENFGSLAKHCGEGLLLFSGLGAGSTFLFCLGGAFMASSSFFLFITGVPFFLMGGFGGLVSLTGFSFVIDAFLKGKGPPSQFSKQVEKMKESIELLPDGSQEKILCQDFMRVVKTVFAMEHLAYLHSKGKKKKGNKVLEQMIADGDIPADQAASLRQAFNSKNFGAPGSYLPRLDEAYKILEAELTAASVRILKSALPEPEQKAALPALAPVI